MWDKGCCTMDGDYCGSDIPCSECAMWQFCATCEKKDKCSTFTWLFVHPPTNEE